MVFRITSGPVYTRKFSCGKFTKRLFGNEYSDLWDMEECGCGEGQGMTVKGGYKNTDLAALRNGFIEV